MARARSLAPAGATRWWWALVLVMWGWSTAARAEPSPLGWLSTATSPPELEQEVRAATLAYIGSLNVEVLDSSTPHATLPEAAAAAAELTDLFELDGVFFVLTERKNRLSIYLYERQGPRLWVQTMDVRAESMQSTIEAVGIVVASASRAILAQTPVGMEPAPMPPPPRPPPRPEPEPETTEQPPDRTKERRRAEQQRARTTRRTRRRRGAEDVAARLQRYQEAFVTLEAGYLGEHISATTPWQSGARLRGQVTMPNALTFALGYRVVPAIRAAAGPHRLVVRRNPIDLSLGYRAPLPRGWFLAPEAAATIDLSRRTARTDDDEARSEPPQTSFAVAVGPRLSAGLTFAARFAAWVSVGVDLWIRRTRFGVAVPNTELLIEPRLVRPWAGLGFSFSFQKPVRIER
ncbi:MAG: hypothetical protein AAGF11_25800 [Myxococcota bacterium]